MNILKNLEHFPKFQIFKNFKKYNKLGFWASFGLKFGFIAKNNVGLCPPDLKRPTGGGDFLSIEVNFDESPKVVY